MSSPSSTQSPPAQIPPPIPEYKPVLPEPKPALTPERKPARATPLKRRLGDTLTARIIKGILRPPIKVLYYLSTWIKKHKLSSLAIIVLLIASIGITNYSVTKQSPIQFGNQQQDSFNFPYKGGGKEGSVVESWLYALRDGDVTQLQLLDQTISQGQAPDPAQLVSQFSQAKTHLTWGVPTVIAVYQQADSTIDSFVQVPITATGPGTTLKGMILWHFVTASITDQNGKSQYLLLGVDMVSLRGLQS